MMNTTDEIAAIAARLVVEEGLEYAAAKHRAARDLGRRPGRPGELPSNERIEEEVRDYLDLFRSESQPGELRALRQLAGRWMDRLAEFRPHVGGAVWRGTATRLSQIIIDLYCDDAKAPEIALLNSGLSFDSQSPGGREHEQVVLRLADFCPEMNEHVTLHFVVHDFDDLRGALKPDAHGRSWRGDRRGLLRLMQQLEGNSQ